MHLGSGRRKEAEDRGRGRGVRVTVRSRGTRSASRKNRVARTTYHALTRVTNQRCLAQLCLEFYASSGVTDARPFCARRPKEMNNNRHAKLDHAMMPVRTHSDHLRH